MPISPWLVCPIPRPHAAVTLVCFPHAGGAAAPFVPWAREIDERVELCVSVLPGREHRLREPLATDISDVLGPLGQAIEALPDRPVVFFGHSLGAMVAFELTRHLRKQGGRLPRRLVVSARVGPTVRDSRPPIGDLPDIAFVDAMTERYNAIPDIIARTPELLAIFLPPLRADMKLNERYRCASEAPLHVPISAWRGRDDHGVPVEDLATWAEQTRAGYRERTFEGGHFYALAGLQPVLRALAEEALASSW